MTYQRFEDLPVWQAALDLGVRVQLMTERGEFAHVQRRGGDLTDQMRRASLSVSNNIAEGFERGTTAELLAYLYIARGSAGEVRSMLHFAMRLPQLAEAREEMTALLALAESCSRQLRGWMDSLQNSTIKGQRHLNEAAKEEFLAKRRKDAFLKKLEEMNAHLRRPPEEEGGT